MGLPYASPLLPLSPSPRVVPEPPRAGEDGGEPCRVCSFADLPPEAVDAYLPLLEEVLPNVSDHDCLAAARRVAAALA